MRQDVRMRSHPCSAVVTAMCHGSKATIAPGQSKCKAPIPSGPSECKALAEEGLPHRSSRLRLAVAPRSEPPLGAAIRRTAGRFLLLGDGPANVGIQPGAVGHLAAANCSWWPGAPVPRSRRQRPLAGQAPDAKARLPAQLRTHSTGHQPPLAFVPDNGHPVKTWCVNLLCLQVEPWPGWPLCSVRSPLARPARVPRSISRFASALSTLP